MNTGIQDAHNLVWKPCAVIENRGPEALLDTHEEERRPVAQRNTDQSVRNLMRMGMTDEALGIQTLAPIAADAADGSFAAWPDAILRIDGEGGEAVRRRADVQRAIDRQAEHFAQEAGTDLGFSYEHGALVPDGSLPPSSSPCAYRPDAHPGARLPFSSPDGTFGRSTLGMVQPMGVTLFAQDGRWREAADQAAAMTGVPVATVVFGRHGLDLGSNAAALLGIGDEGAVAARPDGHVLWRRRDWTGSPAGQLVHALEISHGLAPAAGKEA